jgi:iron complex outermembrane recepter protein
MMERKHSVNLLSAALTLAIGASCGSSIAAAQERLVLEEIFVTAQKRAQSLQEVPVAVAAIDGQKLSDAGINDLQALTAYVPNFYQTRTPTGNVIYIRGIGSGPNLGFEQSVAQYNDGVYMGRARQTLAPLMDLERIEVLRGPQPILFGKNAIAGAVSITTASPTEEFEAELRALVGSHGEEKASAVVSGSLTDTLAARLSVQDHNVDGWIDNDYTGDKVTATDSQAARVIFSWDTSENLTATLKLETSTFDVNGQSYQLIKNSGLAPHLAGLEEGSVNYGNTDPLDGKETTSSNNMDNAVLKFEYQLGEHVLTSISGYSAYDFVANTDLDFSPANLLGIASSEKFTQYSQEIRITSPKGGTFDYIGGIYYQQSDLDIDNDLGVQLSSLPATDAQLTALSNILSGGTNPNLLAILEAVEGYEFTTGEVPYNSTIAGPVGPLGLQTVNLLDGDRQSQFYQESETFAAFFQGTWNITDAARLTAGVRYTRETKDLSKSEVISTYNGSAVTGDGSALLSSLNPAWASAVGAANAQAQAAGSEALMLGLWSNTLDVVPYSTDQKISESKVTPLLTFDYDLNDNTLLYVSASTGFKGGGFDALHTNGNNLDALTFDAEKATAFELGAKMALLENTAELNVALFHTQYDDLQVSTYNGTGGFNVGNAAEATSQGLELDGRLLLSENVLFIFSLAYLDYAFDSYDNAQCTFAQQLADGDPANACFQDLSGKTVNYAPEWTSSLSLSYTMNLSNNLALINVIDVNYKDEYFLASDLEPNTVQDATAKVNLRMALVPSSAKWEVAVIGKNLTDEETASTEIEIPFGAGSFATALDRTRSVAIEGKVRF